MTISINWGTKVITVPKADTQLVQASPTEIRQLDLNTFRLTLKELEGGETGMPYPNTHIHNPPVTVGGVTLARVIEIINGYTVTFEDGQYAVNLVGANSNVGDVTNVNQVSIRSANSAGLTFSEQINDQSFAGAVSLDMDYGLSGTSFPRGTPTDPVNNFPDADTIATARKIRKILLAGSLTTTGADDLSGYTIEGVNLLNAIVIMGGSLAVKTAFCNVSLEGTQGPGFISLRECNVDSVINFEGGMFQCIFNGGTVTLPAVPTTDFDISLYDCVSGIPGAVKPILDVNGCTSDIQIRRYAGGLEIRNMTAANSMSIDLTSGSVLLDASCTGGVIVVRGTGSLTDNSAGTVVYEEGLVEGHHLHELHRMRGLDPDSPVTVTLTEETAGDITLDITGDNTTTNTLTRQP